MIHSDWMFIENQDDLDKLNGSFDWGEGATTVEVFACRKNEDYFPKIISRGFDGLNVHLLIQLLEDEEPDFVEFVLIDCDELNAHYCTMPHFSGRVDSLKRVTLEDTSGRQMRCARLIYRYVTDKGNEIRLDDSAYFKSADSIA